MKNLILGFLALNFLHSEAWAITPAEAVAKLDEITKLRESLAGTLSGRTDPITEETFKQVCAPAGKTLKSWAEVSGLKARQVSTKFRNPDHAPSPEEEAILKEFEKDSARTYIIRSKTTKDKPHLQIFRRIQVTQDCLHCHGEFESRPAFIKLKYPNDRAFGFKTGDLRGMFSVSTK